jgi:hypothetical protein
MTSTLDSLSSQATVSNGYIQLPAQVSASQIQQSALAAIAAALPGWVPREGHIEVLLLEQFAAMVAESAQVAAQVPLAIFSYFGSLIGINPIVGAAATAATTWVMVDSKGYTIPAGTVVGFSVLGNQLFLFQTSATFVVPNGSSSTSVGAIPIVAQEVGTAYNGLAPGPLTLVTSLSYVQSINAEPVAGVTPPIATSGGADAETQAAYLNRLSAELQLLSPRPILPPDFAALATNVPGVYRATAIDELSPGRVINDMTLNSGSPVLSAPDASFTNDDVGRSVSDTLGLIPVGAVIVSPVVSSTTATMSVNANAPGGSPVVVTLGGLTGQERTVTVAAVDVNGDALSAATDTAISTYLEGLREINFIVDVIPPTYTTIDINAQVAALPGANTNTVQAAITSNLESYLSPANWGGGNQTPPVWDINDNTVRYLSVATIIGETTNVDYISSLTIAVHGGPFGTSDIPLAGNAPLTEAGTFSINVVPGD